MRKFLLGLGALIVLSGLVGCSDFTFGRDLEGRVVSTGTRFKATQNGSQQKVSLVVKATQSDSTMDEVAGGPSGVAIECTSTRCSSIVEGTCHHFECKRHRRWGEPDVIECKHLKEVPCPKEGQ